MHEGEIANVTCKGDVDKGGAPNQYAQNSTEIIPVYSDTKYNFEIAECAHIPESFRDIKFGAHYGVPL